MGGQTRCTHADITLSYNTVIMSKHLASQWCRVETQDLPEGRNTNCASECFSLLCEKEGSNIREDKHKWQAVFVKRGQVRLNKLCDSATREKWHCLFHTMLLCLHTRLCKGVCHAGKIQRMSIMMFSSHFVFFSWCKIFQHYPVWWRQYRAIQPCKLSIIQMQTWYL